MSSKVDLKYVADMASVDAMFQKMHAANLSLINDLKQVKEEGKRGFEEQKKGLDSWAQGMQKVKEGNDTWLRGLKNIEAQAHKIDATQVKRIESESRIGGFLSSQGSQLVGIAASYVGVNALVSLIQKSWQEINQHAERHAGTLKTIRDRTISAALATGNFKNVDALSSATEAISAGGGGAQSDVSQTIETLARSSGLNDPGKIASLAKETRGARLLSGENNNEFNMLVAKTREQNPGMSDENVVDTVAALYGKMGEDVSKMSGDAALCAQAGLRKSGWSDSSSTAMIASLAANDLEGKSLFAFAQMVGQPFAQKDSKTPEGRAYNSFMRMSPGEQERFATDPKNEKQMQLMLGDQGLKWSLGMKSYGEIKTELDLAAQPGSYAKTAAADVKKSPAGQMRSLEQLTVNKEAEYLRKEGFLNEMSVIASKYQDARVDAQNPLGPNSLYKREPASFRKSVWGATSDANARDWGLYAAGANPSRRTQNDRDFIETYQAAFDAHEQGNDKSAAGLLEQLKINTAALKENTAATNRNTPPPPTARPTVLTPAGLNKDSEDRN